MASRKQKIEEENVPPDLDLLIDSLSKALQGGKEGEMATDHFLCVYNQLICLFRLFGPGPMKPLQETIKAIKALEIRRVSGAGGHYRRVSSLLSHERREGVQQGSMKLMSGTAAVGLMHEALPYMLAFLKQLLIAVQTQNKYTASKKIHTYTETLGKDHTFLVRSANKLALANSPSAAQLLDSINKCCHGNQDPKEVLKSVVEGMEAVHKKTLQVVSQVQ